MSMRLFGGSPRAMGSAHFAHAEPINRRKGESHPQEWAGLTVCDKLTHGIQRQNDRRKDRMSFGPKMRGSQRFSWAAFHLEQNCAVF
jgi:hypothetical protein